LFILNSIYHTYDSFLPYYTLYNPWILYIPYIIHFYHTTVPLVPSTPHVLAHASQEVGVQTLSNQPLYSLDQLSAVLAGRPLDTTMGQSLPQVLGALLPHMCPSGNAGNASTMNFPFAYFPPPHQMVVVVIIDLSVDMLVLRHL
jgi:hypothetical protein